MEGEQRLRRSVEEIVKFAFYGSRHPRPLLPSANSVSILHIVSTTHRECTATGIVGVKMRGNRARLLTLLDHLSLHSLYCSSSSLPTRVLCRILSARLSSPSTSLMTTTSPANTLTS